MFWIMFYNKKGLLAEIKKTEQKINEKILVLEDLLDSAKSQSLVSNIESKEFFELEETQKTPEKNLVILDKVKAMFVSMVEPVGEPKKQDDAQSKTVHRTLSLQDAELFETSEDDETDEDGEETLKLVAEDSVDLTEGELEFDDLELSEDSDEEESETEEDDIEEMDDDSKDFDNELEEWATSAEDEEDGDVDVIVSLATATTPDEEKTMVGVKSIIKEAKENLEKIDVTDNIKIKSFKDVVLLAKKIDHLR